MKKELMVLALAAMALASCNRDYKQGDGGLSYKIYTDKSGPKINEGDFISVNVVIKNDADSILSSTYKDGHPALTLVPKSQSKGDVITGIKLLTEGDSASFKISADSLFKKGVRPPNFKGKYITYTVKIEKVIAKGKLTDQVFQSTVNSYVQSLSAAIKNQEPAKIEKYISENNLKPAKTDSGLYYTITKNGSGPLPAKNDTILVNYTGKLLNGKVFDTNIYEVAEKAKILNPKREYGPMGIPLGQSKVIAGWDQGLALLNVGSKATLIIPSKLAYGEQGAGSIIGPFTPIVFDVEIVNILHPKPAKK